MASADTNKTHNGATATLRGCIRGRGGILVLQMDPVLKRAGVYDRSNTNKGAWDAWRDGIVITIIEVNCTLSFSARGEGGVAQETHCDEGSCAGYPC